VQGQADQPPKALGIGGGLKRHADVIIPEGAQMGVSVEFLCSLVREKLLREKEVSH